MSLWRQIYDFFFQLSVFCANYLINSAKIGRNETKTRCLQSSNETSSHFLRANPSLRRKDKISSDDEKKTPHRAPLRNLSCRCCCIILFCSKGASISSPAVKKTYEVAHVLVPQFG